MIRQEVQWLVDDSHDLSKFKPYSSLGGSYRHRETKLVIARDWLGVPGFGSIKDFVQLNEEELAAIKESYERVHGTREQARQAKIWADVQGRFKKRAQAVYQFIREKAGLAAILLLVTAGCEPRPTSKTSENRDFVVVKCYGSAKFPIIDAKDVENGRTIVGIQVGMWSANRHTAGTKMKINITTRTYVSYHELSQ